jgi:hypothetical protein
MNDLVVKHLLLCAAVAIVGCPRSPAPPRPPPQTLTGEPAADADRLLDSMKTDGLWVRGASLATVRRALDGGRWLEPDEALGFIPVSPDASLSALEGLRLAYRLRTTIPDASVEPQFFQSDPVEVAARRLIPAAWAASDDSAVSPGTTWHLEADAGARVFRGWKHLDGGAWARLEKVVIAHPDSGKKRHPEAIPDPKIAFEYDYVDEGREPFDPLDGHGLSTSSVFGSLDDRADGGTITGVAPGVRWAPLRVSKKNWFVPSPVLFSDGAARLVKAIDLAVARGADIISISLGWFGSEALHEAVQRAVNANVIVVAAGGNGTPMVVWPAAYDEAIAVAATTPSGQRWFWSAPGKAIDIAAPGHRIWVARAEPTYAEHSSGTSHATAMLAGTAALWLARHDKARLKARFPGQPFQQIFRRALERTAQPASQRWLGKGHLNVEALLSESLEALAAPVPITPSFTTRERSSPCDSPTGPTDLEACLLETVYRTASSTSDPDAQAQASWTRRRASPQLLEASDGGVR